jgi:hypothetical protein
VLIEGITLVLRFNPNQ